MKERAFAEVAAALARRRARRHLSRRQAHATPASINRVPPRRPADPRDDAGAGRADGAARAVGQLLVAVAGAARCAASAASSRASRSSQRRPCVPARRRPSAVRARERAARRRALIGATNGERVDADRDDVAGRSGRNDDRAGPRRCTCRRFRRLIAGLVFNSWRKTRAAAPLPAAAPFAGADADPFLLLDPRVAERMQAMERRIAALEAALRVDNGRGRARRRAWKRRCRCARSGGRDARSWTHAARRSDAAARRAGR